MNELIDITLSDASGEHVTLTDAKDWCKVAGTADDTIITQLIIAATRAIENMTGLSLKPRVVVAILKADAGDIELPFGPIAGVTSITDSLDITVTSNYTITGLSFKRVKEPFTSPLKFTYNAGYTVLPAELKTAILMQVAYMYDNRGDSSKQAVSNEASWVAQKYSRLSFLV